MHHTKAHLLHFTHSKLYQIEHLLKHSDYQDEKGPYAMQFVDNAGPDQPAHLRRLIWAFIVLFQNQL